MAENSDLRWIPPESRRKAVQRAKYRAQAKRWNLNTAILLSAVLVTVFVLGIIHISFWVSFLIILLGFGCVWLMGKRKAAGLFAKYLEEELGFSTVEWKDYYTCLGVGPSANAGEIARAYRNYSSVYNEMNTGITRMTPHYSIRYRDASEAFSVLSETESKAEYDRIYWLKYNGEKMDLDVPVREEIVSLSQHISQEFSEYLARFGWRLPVLTRFQRRMCIVAVAVLLAVGVTGTSIAFAMPESALAAPFRGTAVTLAQITGSAVSFIDDIRAIGSSSERQVVSTALQLMRVEEHLVTLEPVTEPTNDMSAFPSSEHSLFPEYLDRRYSQFEYTVDAKGIVTVHTQGSTTGPLLEKIKEMIQSEETVE